MTIMLRVVLIVVSVLTTVLILKKIRHSKLQIEDSLFWIFLSFVLILFSVFPALPAFLARLAGTYTTANFIFLSVIFLLMVKMFHMTLKISQLETKVKELVQEMAIEENRREKERKERNPEAPKFTFSDKYSKINSRTAPCAAEGLGEQDCSGELSKDIERSEKCENRENRS